MYIRSLLLGGGIVLLCTSFVYAAEFDEEGDVEPTTPVTGYSIKRGMTASPLPSESAEPLLTPIPEQNMPPRAHAGRDQTVFAGALVVLSAGESRDPDGSIVSYNWKQISGSPVELLSSRTPNPSFFAEASPATHIFALTVRDDDGMTAMDVVTVVVRPRVIASPVVDVSPAPTPTATPAIPGYSVLQNTNLLLGILGVVLIALLSIIARVVFKPESS